MLNVFDYEKPEEFLKDTWTTKRRKNSSFSIRAWAQQMGIKHHNPLHEMVLGKRKIPKALIPTLIKNLNLSANEGLYFEILVDYQRAKSVEEKTLYLERMLAMNSRKAVKFTELESFRLLENPLHFFIAELALHKDFKADASWIKARLGFKVSLLDINEAIERLTILDILREDAEGKLQRMDHFIQSKSDISDRALKTYHKNLLELASQAVEAQDVLEREFQGMALNIDPKRMPQMKKTIRQFINQFTAEFDTPKVPGEELYQINLQFFGITKNINKGERK